MIRLLGASGLALVLLAGCTLQQEKKGVTLPRSEWTDDRVAQLVDPPPKPVVAEVPEDPPPVPRRRPKQIAALPDSDEEGQTDEGPAIEGLVGLDFDATQALLGEPAVDEVHSPARVWAYTGHGCVLSIFFYPNVDGQSYRALTYEVKSAQDSPEQVRACFAELVREKKGT